MITYAKMEEFVSKGFSYPEVRVISDSNQVALAEEMLKNGKSKVEIMAFVSGGKGVTTSKKQAGFSPIVKSTSAGAVKSEINFGGITTADVIDYGGSIAVKNDGNGKGRSNSLWLRLSDKEGKIDPAWAHARVQEVLRTLEQHATICDTVSTYLEKMASELGVVIPE
jgi:hypothetical protein